MSLIDPLTIEYSAGRATKQVNPDQASVIEGLKSVLTGVGWTLQSSLKATCSIAYPLGFPIVDGTTVNPKRVVGCGATPFLLVGSTSFVIYDPGKEVPLAGAPCIFVPMHTTPQDSINQLASQVSASGFNATVDQLSSFSFVLNLEAAVAGPLFNFYNVIGDGRWAGVGINGGLTSGGGYQLKSKSDPEATQYSIKATGFPSVFGNITIQFMINGGSAFYYISPNAYTLVANGFGFFLGIPGDNGGTFPFNNRALFAMAPRMPAAENFDPSSTGVFILGARTFEFATYYFGAAGYISTAVDAAPATYSNTGGWPRLLAYHSPGPPLLTAVKKPVVIAAYIMFGPSASSGADVIGKLWDCAVVSDIIAAGTTIDGQRFVTVGSQPGINGEVASTLVMFAPLPVPDPPPPAPTPVYPQTQPSSRSGTCNVFGSGVTALTGSFAGLPHLNPITIDGIPYLIDTVTDPTHCTLTTASIIKSGVNWTVV